MKIYQKSIAKDANAKPSTIIKDKDHRKEI